ncbi:CHAP domain-containing protein [Actinomadura opuntiae]|uniref:CHAP domain-containing protein n=1 Tax=Actinomadura sp. OS1-43 TaxID=604315 RepID=UPI00255AC090|nr:CHAP domain-containing protein [Actinomadura sp. OS1-43]MDL4813998.1 CHAP domain-containing protein [Actinomadura sp. OS1-43]
MTGRFDRLIENIAPRLSALRPTGAAPRAALARMSPEDRAVGVAVAGVMAGAVGLAIFNPLTGDTASAETPAQAAAVAGRAGAAAVGERVGSEHAKSGRAESGRSAREARSASRAVAASTVIKLAKSQVGVEEGRNGFTKYANWYASTSHAAVTARRDGGSVHDYKGAEWCDMFVSWLSAQTGVRNMGWDAYTVQHASWFKDKGKWGTKARPGAVVFFDWQNGSRGGIDDIDHVGLVVKDNGNGTISTIEGNTDNAVKEKVRDKSEVVGYGYPDYAKS